MKGVMITDFGKDPDGNKVTLLRLWKQADVSTMATIQLPYGIKTRYAIPVNVTGKIIGKKILVKDNKLVVSLQKSNPMCFILQIAE